MMFNLIYDSTYLNNMSMKLYILAGLLLAIVVSIDPSSPKQVVQPHKEAESGVEVVNSTTINKLIADHPKLLLFFGDVYCQNCKECSQAYALVNQQQPNSAHFAKIYLTTQNKPIFKQFNITDFPRILAFIGGKLTPHQFQCLGGQSTMEKQMVKWISRLDPSLREWGGEEDHQHQLIVHCESDQQKKLWKKVERSQLWLDIYCGSGEFLGSNLAVVGEKGRSIEAWQFDSANFSEFQAKISRLIRSYKYKYVLYWNTAVIQQVFLHKQNAFVMIVNNQSLSLGAYEVYEAVKENWYQNADRYEPILFAVSELAKTTYQSTKLKRFLTGLAASSRKHYYYPMLAFIESKGERVRKFVMRNQIVKNRDNIQRWMESVYQHIVMGRPYEKGEEQIAEWFSDDLQKKGKKDKDEQASFIDDLEAEPKQALYLQDQNQWSYMLSSKFNKPFFVYFTWRYDYEFQKMESDVVLWWQSKDEQTGVTPIQKIKLMVHQLHSIDVPAHKGLKIDYLPTLVYIDEKKQVEVFGGVTQMGKIMDIFKGKMKKGVNQTKAGGK